MTEDYIKFVDRLKKLRADNNLSQLDMAQKMGLNTHAQVSKIENLVTSASVECLLELNKTVPIDFNWLILGKSANPADLAVQNMVSLAYGHINFLSVIASRLLDIAELAADDQRQQMAEKTDTIIEMINNEIAHILKMIQRIKQRPTQ